MLALALGSFATAGLTSVTSRPAAQYGVVQQDLSTILARVIDSLPATTDSATYEAQLAGAIESSGATCPEAEAALLILKGRTGLTPAALQAILALSTTVSEAGCQVGVGSVLRGGSGPSAFGSGPAFTGGGTGSDYTPL
ncbi:hypothetical protein BZG35_05680 [Brevundimonas sp. LM2]|nr:hypothetical protein BZG35_05680 [Brevundimonas sp. LM2]